MEVSVKVCPTCGSTSISLIDKLKAICNHCGNTLEIESKYPDQVNSLLVQARIMLNALDFKVAKFYYEESLSIDNTLHEAYFGMFISDYGIEYVKDPKSNEYLPTCHKTSTISVFDNPNFQKAINYSEGEIKAKYLSLATEYEKIRMQIISKANNYDDYDIFICYKSKNENNTFTKEHDFAIELYYELKESNKKVFFADISLQKYAGKEYEAIIYKGLSSAKLMIIVAFDINNLNSTWVKNEWNRFLELKSYDDDKKLVLLYKDLSPYDLPSELRNLQALDTNRYSYINSLREIIRNLKVSSEEIRLERKEVHNEKLSFNEVLPNKIEKNSFSYEEAIPVNNKNNLENAEAFLARGSFKTAERFFRLAIKENPRVGSAYFGLLMSLIETRNYEEIPANIQKLEDISIFIKAVKNSDEITSLEYINIFTSAVVEKVNIKDYKTAVKIYDVLIHWVKEDTADYLSNLIFKLAYDMVDLKKSKEAIKIFESSLKSLSQEEILIYLDRHYLFADKLRKSKKFNEAKYINKRVLKVNSNLVKGRWGLLLSSYCISNNNKIYRKLISKGAVKKLENILEKEYNQEIITDLMNSCFYGVSKNHYKLSIKLFDKVVAYIPIEYNDVFIQYIWTFGNKLLARKHYNQAIKYFNEMTKLQTNNSRAYMGKVMCKYQVNDVDKLMYVKADFTKDRDFIKALSCDDEYAQSYVRMRKKRRYL